MSEIFDSPPVQVVQLALRRTAPHECRDGLDQETKLTLALTKRFFGALSVFDVGVDPVPSDDVALLVTQRIRTEEKPSILAVMPTQTRFGFTCRFRRHDALPGRGQAAHIVGVHGSRPTPTAGLFCREADEIHVVLVEKVRASIWTRRPCECRNRVDAQFEVPFARAQRVFGALPIVDVGKRNVPAGNMPSRIAKRTPTNLKPTVDAIETPDACLEVVWLACRDRLRKDLADVR